MHTASKLFAAAVLATLPSLARADVHPAALFGDHMVLQAATNVPIWGTAAPGEQVTVTLGDQKQAATATGDGKWELELTNLKTGGPYEVTIAGKNSVTIKDVLVGEVWLGSGQSNMEFSVSTKVKSFAGVNNEAEEIAAANYPQVRMFVVKMKLSEKPLDDVEGSWQVCSPQTVPAFSAVGYFFSRDLHKAINQPVGFIDTSYGASTAQCWIKKEVMNADPRYKPIMDAYSAAVTAYDNRASAPPASAPATSTAPAPAGRGARPPRAAAVRNPHQDQHNPSQLWNAMLSPCQPYAIRGVLWYQGESIVGGIPLYAPLMETLVKEWRQEWNRPNLPFYAVQLAALDNNSNSPAVREAQSQILKLPNTGLAITIDIGDQKNVHPKNKQDLGDRLTRIALANVYGQKVEFSGPVYQSMKIEGSSIRLSFTHAEGLMAKGGDLKTFTIVGADNKFVPATAKIDGQTIVVSSPDMPEPKSVRYAWSNYPEGCNLYNAAGLPAAPFRTDAP